MTPSQFMAEPYFMKWLQLEYWTQTTASEDTGLAISCCSGSFPPPRSEGWAQGGISGNGAWQNIGYFTCHRSPVP